MRLYFFLVLILGMSVCTSCDSPKDKERRESKECTGESLSKCEYRQLGEELYKNVQPLLKAVDSYCKGASYEESFPNDLIQRVSDKHDELTRSLKTQSKELWPDDFKKFYFNVNGCIAGHYILFVGNRNQRKSEDDYERERFNKTTAKALAIDISSINESYQELMK